MDITGIGSIADLIRTGIDKIWPDPAKAAEAKIAILQAEQAGTLKDLDNQFQLALEQIKTNAAEAAQPGLHFRDGAGWVCVAAFALIALKTPLEWVSIATGHPMTLPSFDASMTNDMLYGLLGLGGMHVYAQTKKS